MSIRLNKAIRELNIGLQTAVEFLESKKNLGEITADQNFKLNDEQYRALVEAFKQDAEVRNEAEKLFQKKPKEKKKRQRDERGLVAGTKKSYTFELTSKGYDLERVTRRVLKKFPDANAKSISLWYRKAKRGVK